MSKIVFKGKTSDGISYIIRYPKRRDLQEFWRYINELSKEKTFINYQGEEITLKEERIWLNGVLKRIREKKSVLLLAESSGKIIGDSGVEMQSRAKFHTGTFGISISKEFRGKGIGKRIMEYVLKEAEKNLPGLKIVYLSAFGINPVAIDMYKSFGFKEFGMLPGGLMYKGNQENEVFMYHEVKS